MNSWQLAQLNIARLGAPIVSPQLSEFVEQLDEINALADDAPGFVWRLMSDAGDARKLALLEANGPSSAAFTFKRAFAIPGSTPVDDRPTASFDDGCPAP